MLPRGTLPTPRTNGGGIPGTTLSEEATGACFGSRGGGGVKGISITGKHTKTVLADEANPIAAGTVFALRR